MEPIPHMDLSNIHDVHYDNVHFINKKDVSSNSYSLQDISSYSDTGSTTDNLPGQHSSSSLIINKPKEKVALIGSGNWGSVIAKIVGNNVWYVPNTDPVVKMWVFEEKINGQNLSDIINTQHENVKYLPGFKLPDNVIADPDLISAVKDATLIIFVIPHQFVRPTCEKLKGKLHPNARALSLIKGVDFDNGLNLISDLISDSLGIDVSVLMGANIAAEVAAGKFCEATLGTRNRENGEAFFRVLNSKTFRLTIISDVPGTEICGALKNVVAIGAGIVDGLKMGENTKAAIIRIGLIEMIRFSKELFPTVSDSTFFESCGVADVITTCFGGRNRKVAEAHVVTGKSFDELEKELLNGQKLQGTLTSKEVYLILQQRNKLNEFPFFVKVYKICYENLPPHTIVEDLG